MILKLTFWIFLIWTLCSFKSYLVHIYSSKCGEGTRSLREKWQPCHGIMVLFILRKLILQTRMRSHPAGLDVWFLVGSFFYFHTSCVQSAKALVSLHGCTGSPEPSLVTYVISTIISLSWHKFSILFYSILKHLANYKQNVAFLAVV